MSPEDPLDVNSMKLVSASISTTAYSRAYLQRAWANRVGLSEYERNGFAVYFYTTVCGHIEACIAELIDRRIMFARAVVDQFREGTFSWRSLPDAMAHPTLPIHETLNSLLLNVGRRTEKASLESLSELYQDVFAVQLASVLGDAFPDLKALACLRNVFAHGRDMSFRFNQDDRNLISLESNPFQLPAQRLLAARVLSTLQFNAGTYNDLERAFFSDEAMLYFVRQARDIENKLKSVPTFPPERELPLMVALPDLGA